MKRWLVSSLVLILWNPLVAGEILTFQGTDTWLNWSFDPAVIEIAEDGVSVAPGAEQPARMTSSVVELAEGISIDRIEWNATLPEGCRIEIQTRTGESVEGAKQYFDKDGNEVAEEKFNKLPKSKKGEIRSSLVPGADWSSWSAPYSFSGETFLSPAPRRYLQVQFSLISEDPQLKPILHSLSFIFEEGTAIEANSWGQVKADREYRF